MAPRAEKENPGLSRGLLGYLVSAGAFRLNSPRMLSNSSTFAPWRRMMIACWMTDRVLFQAQ